MAQMISNAISTSAFNLNKSILNGSVFKHAEKQKKKQNVDKLSLESSNFRVAKAKAKICEKKFNVKIYFIL